MEYFDLKDLFEKTLDMAWDVNQIDNYRRLITIGDNMSASVAQPDLTERLGKSYNILKDRYQEVVGDGINSKEETSILIQDM